MYKEPSSILGRRYLGNGLIRGMFVTLSIGDPDIAQMFWRKSRGTFDQPSSTRTNSCPCLGISGIITHKGGPDSDWAPSRVRELEEQPRSQEGVPHLTLPVL